MIKFNLNHLLHHLRQNPNYAPNNYVPIFQPMINFKYQTLGVFYISADNTLKVLITLWQHMIKIKFQKKTYTVLGWAWNVCNANISTHTVFLWYCLFPLLFFIASTTTGIKKTNTVTNQSSVPLFWNYLNRTIRKQGLSQYNAFN